MRYPFPHLGQFQIAQVHILGDGLQDLPPMDRRRHHTAVIARQCNRRGRLVDGPGAALVATSAQIASLLQRRRVPAHAMQIHVTAPGAATAGAVVLRAGCSKCRLEGRLCREVVRFRRPADGLVRVLQAFGGAAHHPGPSTTASATHHDRQVLRTLVVRNQIEFHRLLVGTFLLTETMEN